MIVRQSLRTFVDRLSFRTSLGDRVTTGFTDLGMLRRDPCDGDLVLTHLHPGATVHDAHAATGWPLLIDDDLTATGSAHPRRARSSARARSLEGRAV